MNRSPRRWVKTFKPQFAEMVREGLKLQTMRPMPKRERDMPCVGDIIDCRQWSGLPYRSKQSRLVVGELIEVESVTIYRDAATVSVTMSSSAWFVGGEIHVGSLDKFAIADGFPAWPYLVAWFEREHGPLPWSGILLRWKVLP